MSTIIQIISGYFIVVFMLIILDFENIKNFLKYEAPAEIAVFKKEYKIEMKFFNILAMSIFLFLIPIMYMNRRE